MFQPIKLKDSVTDLKPITRILRHSWVIVLLWGCAHQIDSQELSQNCDKDSTTSPASVATIFYNEYYGDGCTSASKQVGLSNTAMPYKEIKDNIETRQCYHDAVLAYPTWKTQHSLYLLGFEKPRNTSTSEKPYQLSPTDNSGPVTFNPESFNSSATDDQNAVSDTQTYIHKVLNDPESIVLTHVLRVKSTTPNIDGANRAECFLYNIYTGEQQGNATPWCDNNYKTTIKPSNSHPKWTQEGWKALDELGNQIREEIKQKAQNGKAPTHIIMLATGWNTRERESFLDFQKWMDELQKNFESNGESFNPIFVGITSELEWPGGGKPTWASMVNKGRDADELGFTWVNYLLNSVLKPIAKETGIRLVGIGHSFGSRIILGSHYARNIFKDRAPALEEIPVTLIGMQAAFPTGRFSSTRGRDYIYWWPPGLYKSHPYLSANKGAATVVITTSKSDAATGIMTSGYLTTGFIGGRGGLSELDNYPEDYKTAIHKIGDDKVKENGEILEAADRNLVNLYDASKFVCCELPGTESGSHSDVYDSEMGNFLFQIIRDTSKQRE